MDEKELNGFENKDEELFDEETVVEEKIEIEAETEATSDELSEELESIREMFQRELDSAENENNITYESPTGEILIQGLDEIGLEFDELSPGDENEDDEAEDEDEEIDEEDLCQCCGEKRRNIEFGEDYPYCDDCRALMLHNPLNLVGVLVSILVCLVAGLSIGLLAANIEQYSTLVDAEVAYDSKNLTSAAASFYNYVNSVSPESVHSSTAVKHAATVFSKLGYMSDAGDIIERFFTEQQLKMPWNRKVKKLNDYQQKLFATDSYISETVGETIQSQEFEKALEAIEPLIEENAKNIESEDAYNQAYLEYIKYYILYSKGDDDYELIEVLNHLKETDEKYYGGQNQWMYLTPFISRFARLGDVESAKKYFDIMLDINKQDIYGYIYLADAHRFGLSKKSDDTEISAAADAILEIAGECEEMFKNQTSVPPYYYRLSAVAYLLKGESDLAMQNIENYLNGAGQNVTIADYNLYCVCAIESGDTEKYQETVSMLEMYGQTIPKSVRKLEKGKITVFDIIIDKEGDI